MIGRYKSSMLVAAYTERIGVFVMCGAILGGLFGRVGGLGLILLGHSEMATKQ
jgi:hypothetical protein